MLVMACALALAACGGDDAASKEVPSKDLKALKGQSAKGGATAAERGEPAITPQDRRRRAAIMLLREKLEKVKDPDERADLLAEVAQFGVHAKPLWSAVLAGFRDEEPFTRAVALETAAKVDPLGCQPLLLQGLGDDESEVREMAAAAWALAGIKELSPLLDRIENEFEARVQFAIMVAVEAVGEKHHVPLVAKVVGDLDPSALKPTIRFLGKHGAKDHAGTIVDCLEKDDVDLRILAARTLKALGVKAKPILSGLASALLDDEPGVREAAVNALKSLTGQDLGYDPSADEDTRSQARAAWVEWISRNT